jgi:hypothetical protein
VTEDKTTFEYEGGVYKVGRETIRARMNTLRVRDLTIKDSIDTRFLTYGRMFLQLIANTTHVDGEHTLPVVDTSLEGPDTVISEAWEAFLVIDPTGWEDDFWAAYFWANPTLNKWVATPAALNELLETDEKKDGLTDYLAPKEESDDA